MKSGGEGAGGTNGFLLWIQLEEKRTRKGKRVGESFWILFSEKYVYISLLSLSYFFFPSPPPPPPPSLPPPSLFLSGLIQGVVSWKK